MRNKEIIGVLNAGGKSRRMGQNKALLEWQGETFLARAARILQSCFSKVILIANDPAISLAGLERHADAFPDAGPMGGIATALKIAAGKPVFVLGCDLPLVTSDLINFLIQKAQPETPALVPVSAGQMQPMCALYFPAILPDFETRIDNHELKLTRALKGIQPQFVPIDTDSYLNYHSHLFFNLNDQDDLQELRNFAL